MRVSPVLNRLRLDHFFDVLFNFCTWQHHFSSAAGAADLEIHAHAQHLKAGSTAGVLFAGEDGIAHSNVHIVGRSLLPAGGQALYLRQTQLLRAAHTDIV